MARKANRASGRERPDIELEISDFGPIAGGRIALRPLTVLVGPNNSGKTYASVLAHSVISACADLSAVARSGYWAGALLESGEFKGLSARAARLAASANGGGGDAVPRDLSAKMHDCTVRRLFEGSLLSRMRHNFGSPLGDLVRAGSKSSRIRIGGPLVADVAISRRGSAAVRVAHRAARAPRRGAGGAARNGRAVGLPAQGRGHAALLDLAAEIAGHAVAACPGGTSHYVPAARSGVVCAYGALAPGILAGLHHGAGTAGTVSDLVASLARGRSPAPARNGRPRRGTGMVSDVLGGRVARARTGAGALSYAHMGEQVPIHRSSAGVVATAPLALAAAGMGPGDTLVVEEPEAHLHPKSQAVLARRMAGLVRRGMRVILSTHSAFFLAQLSILVRAGTLASSGRRIPGYGQHDYVTDDEVAPYAFRARTGGKHDISEIEHSGDEGISQDEFVDVAESMSREDFLIDGALEG